MRHHYDFILFDLDGTISDPITGIGRSINYALEHFGYAPLDHAAQLPWIGPPLYHSFKAHTGVEDSAHIEALIAKYRERYGDVGYAENTIYPGVAEAVAALAASGVPLGLCTSKRADFAQRILELFGIAQHFRFVDGGDIHIEKWEQMAKLRERGIVSDNSLMIGIPLIQMTLFGFAINGDPKHLPTAIVAEEQGTLTRSIVRAMENSAYFRVVAPDASARDAERMLADGRVQFAITIPAGFARAIVRGEQPALLLDADATDPSATGNAIAALQQLAQSALRHDLVGQLAQPQVKPAFELRVHRRYNPDGVTQYNIVPGLMGVILTMTMIMMTSLAITREVERGTMENLLATPVRPFEVMVGKIAPYIVIGYVQVFVILAAARWIFGVPFVGSFLLLMCCVLLFITANLTVGITISSVARTQTQAMQMTFFFFLPSILLSGFMFPFRGMPGWAQAIGEALPLTHFLRLIRGVMLKGNGPPELWTDVWPLLLFILVAMGVGLKRFRKTLD